MLHDVGHFLAWNEIAVIRLSAAERMRKCDGDQTNYPKHWWLKHLYILLK
jgi:hypothetical protein